MKITLISHAKLKVTLNTQDIIELADYTPTGAASPLTKSAMLALLKRIGTQSGFRTEGKKILVEIKQERSGDCTVYFTALGSANASTGTGLRPAIFAFESTADLCAGASKLFSLYSHRIYKSSLYIFRGEWRIIMYPLDYADRLSVYFLSEFASFCGEDTVLAAFIDEHGRKVIEDNALDIISRHFAAG